MALYSKTVMEHFMHPRYVGEIKNADGVGTVGNPVCLPPDGAVISNPRAKPIDSFEKTDCVLGHDGSFHPVAAKMFRNYSGDLVCLKNRFGETRITPEHKVLAVRVPKTHRFAFVKNKKKLSREWIEAGALSKGDLCAYPTVSETRDLLELEIPLSKRRFDYRSKKIPVSVAVDGDFLRLAGYFLSEGNLKEKVTKTYLGFTFSSKENEFADDVLRITAELFGLAAKKKIVTKHNTIYVTINNVHLVRFFKSLFGNGAAEKSIPPALLFLSPEKQKELIKGLWRGGGFFNKKIPRAGYSTISAKLAEQVKTLLLRQGVIPSLYSEPEKTVDGVHHRKSYRIHVGRRGVEKLAEILGEKLTMPKKTFRDDSWFAGGFAFVPITSKTTELYAGPVLNLAVEESHSYVTPSLALHNCGDLLTVYITVKSGRIAGIKFKTFGCAAALATSDMICDLAKGKTLEDALKLTRADVAESLQGLPAIKMHCSNLAADALGEAIYDYYSRRKEKIPKALLERHERVQRHAAH